MIKELIASGIILWRSIFPHYDLIKEKNVGDIRLKLLRNTKKNELVLKVTEPGLNLLKMKCKDVIKKDYVFNTFGDTTLTIVGINDNLYGEGYGWSGNNIPQTEKDKAFNYLHEILKN